MEPDFWHQRWQQQRIGFHQSEVNFFLRNYWPQLQVAPGRTVFVPLCGKALDMAWLAAQGHRVIGVELSEIAVEAFFREQNLVPQVTSQDAFVRYQAGAMTLLCGDFFALQAEDLAGADAVFDRAALIALPAAMRRRYAEHLANLLPAGSDMLLVSMEYDESARQGPPFSVRRTEIEALFAGACSLKVLAERPEEARGTPCTEILYHLQYR